jgi:predicted HNH restriction endonuclease
MKTQRDKGFLLELAKAAQMELQSRHIGSPFRLKKKIKPIKTNSDGWAIPLGTFAGYKCRAEIWLDRFTAYTERKIYYCLYSHQKEGLAKLAQAAYRDFGKHLSICLKDWDNNSKDHLLAKKLAKYRFGRPIYERYPENGEFLYGIYEYDSTGLQKNVLNRLVTRSIDFFQTIAEAVSSKTHGQDNEEYPSVENRQTVIRHICRERKSHAATLCKHRDNFICQVCGFDYSIAYGSLGNDFAEAHHIVPLSSNKKLRSTTINDLITVCANCHRMLHRMAGETQDINSLKKIMKIHKRK